jgi:tetratricopeptide (TPR) repeat protein
MKFYCAHGIELGVFLFFILGVSLGIFFLIDDRGSFVEKEPPPKKIAIAIDPEYSEVLRKQSQILKKSGRRDDAIKMAEKAVRLDPKNEKARVNFENIKTKQKE